MLLAEQCHVKPGCLRALESIVLLQELGKHWNIPVVGGAQAVARGTRPTCQAPWGQAFHLEASRSCSTEAKQLMIYYRGVSHRENATPAKQKLRRVCAASKQIRS